MPTAEVPFKRFSEGQWKIEREKSKRMAAFLSVIDQYARLGHLLLRNKNAIDAKMKTMKETSALNKRLIVSANPYRTSKFTCHVMHRARAIR